MTVHHQAHQKCIDSGLGFEWDLLPDRVTRVEDCSGTESSLRLRRDNNSHRGIGPLRSLTALWAYGVNQSLLDEICRLHRLELLALDKEEFAAIAEPLPQARCDWFPSRPQADGMVDIVAGSRPRLDKDR